MRQQLKVLAMTFGLTVLSAGVGRADAPAVPSCGSFDPIQKELQITFDAMGKDLTEQAATAQKRADEIKSKAPDKKAVVFEFKVKWTDQRYSLHLPSVTMKNQEWLLRLPEVTSHDQHIIFDVPVTRMVTEVIAKIPGLKCDGFPPKCEVTQKDIIATRPIVEMQRRDIVLTIPDFAMREKRVVVGVPEFSAQQQEIVMRVPEFTLKDVKVEAEKVEKEANQLADETNAATKTRMGQARVALSANTVPKITAYFACIETQLLSTRTTIVNSYNLGEVEYRRAIGDAQNNQAAAEAATLTAKMGELFKERDAELAKVDSQIANITKTETDIIDSISKLGQ